MRLDMDWHADVLSGRRVLLGVTGSIAAYKAPALASEMVRAGAEVDVVLTDAASELVRPMAFQALTHRSVTHDLWSPTGPMGMDHLALARSAEAMVIAPATAHTIARLATGLADDALTTAALAVRCPILLAPAMEPRMWQHPATQQNIATLRDRGLVVVGPEEGRLASGAEGRGRMSEPGQIVEALRSELGRNGPLAGCGMVITAGGTREPIDPVRFLGNRSTGRMGIALATAARDHGARVTLILGTAEHPPPLGLRVVRVERADELRDAVLSSATDPECDALIMAAAVADFRPKQFSVRKIKKSGSDSPTEIELERTPDVLLELAAALRDASQPPVRVGFAAETDDLERMARGKLDRKELDLVVANRVPGAFGDGRPELLLVEADRSSRIPPADKRTLAVHILRAVHRHLHIRGAAGFGA